jgi:hypothetical protein
LTEKDRLKLRMNVKEREGIGSARNGLKMHARVNAFKANVARRLALRGNASRENKLRELVLRDSVRRDNALGENALKKNVWRRNGARDFGLKLKVSIHHLRIKPTVFMSHGSL